MNILVTGCAGFIGSALVNKLNSNIIGLDIKPTKQNIKFYQVDIRDVDSLNKIFEENHIDVVIHLAAKAGVRASILNPDEYIETNIDGTTNILNAMKKYNVPKLIFASSSSVYGNAKEVPFKEDMHNLKPISPYACTKLACEKFIEMYSKLYGISAVCLRFFTVYGPNQRKDLAIQKFTSAILNNQPLTLYGDGSTYRDYTYIDDIAAGIISAINYNETPFEIINLGSNNPIKLIDLVNLLEKELKKKAIIEYLPMQEGDVQRTYADISKAEKLLGYKPKLTFQDGLRRFISSREQKD